MVSRKRIENNFSLARIRHKTCFVLHDTPIAYFVFGIDRGTRFKSLASCQSCLRALTRIRRELSCDQNKGESNMAD